MFCDAHAGTPALSGTTGLQRRRDYGGPASLRPSGAVVPRVDPPDRWDHRLYHGLRTTVVRQGVGGDADRGPKPHAISSPRAALCIARIRFDLVVGPVGTTLEFHEPQESGAESPSGSAGAGAGSGNI